jgi:alkanesulfonate monooxygenase SsuD/methylene tetrahydromethanopterin reductase-like flavin-dependent oxidoreductase (luciferase family)
MCTSLSTYINYNALDYPAVRPLSSCMVFILVAGVILMTKTSRFRLGFFTYLLGDKPVAETYAQTVELFQVADQLGFDVAWVAQQHFGYIGGLPTPFVFFSAVAERTQRIGFGTAVISLPLEDPLRTAEDAAVFETLYPGRLQLGLGTGITSDTVFATFGKSGADKRALYDNSIGQVIDALAGKPLNDNGDVLMPPGNALLERIWESPSTNERVAEASRRGSGLLLSRVAIGAGLTPTHEVQIPMVDLYKRELKDGYPVKIGMSRTVYPTRDPENAYQSLSAGIAAGARARAKLNLPEDSLSTDEAFRHYNVHYGRSDDVITSVRSEPLLDEITDLICQVSPGTPDHDQTLRALELLATEVAPALGWVPTHARETLTAV